MDKYFPTSDVVSSNRTLYTPSRFARASLLHLQEIGTLQALKSHTSSRDNLSSFLFFIVLSGEGELHYQKKPSMTPLMLKKKRTNGCPSPVPGSVRPKQI